MVLYDTLASVYDWLVPEPLLTPHGSVEAFADVVSQLPPGARVLDCAAGTGRLAVGLALHGFEVVASDASPEMIERTRALAGEHGVALHAHVCAWEDLAPDQPFDAVFCVGNSITHAPTRRDALAAMRSALCPEGRLVLTSRNWERLRAARPRIEVGERLIERGGRRALTVHVWTIPDAWDEPHALDVTIAIIAADGRVDRRHEHMPIHPFRHTELDADLRAVGLTPTFSSYAPDVDRYLVSARLGPGGARRT